jgi:hypothetical protein
MKREILLIVCLLIAAPVLAGTIKLPAAPRMTLEVTPEGGPFKLKAGLLLSAEVREAIHVVRTSPFDKMKYPIGAFTADLFARNLDQVFAGVVATDSATTSDVDVTVEVTIDRFEAVIPHPAYNPYTASMVYRIRVTDAGGEVLLVQTVIGEGQTSKGMMSGFKAKQLAAESAVRAMVAAAIQAMEALAEAPELIELAAASAPAPSS